MVAIPKYSVVGKNTDLIWRSAFAIYLLAPHTLEVVLILISDFMGDSLIVLPLLRVPDTGLFKRFSSVMIAGVSPSVLHSNAAILWDQNLKLKSFSAD
jgi:hypothetical protein